MLFQSEEDVRKAGITFVGEAVDWDSREARELVEIIKPSTKQINFSIGEPLLRQTGKLIGLCCCSIKFYAILSTRSGSHTVS